MRRGLLHWRILLMYSPQSADGIGRMANLTEDDRSKSNAAAGLAEVADDAGRDLAKVERLMGRQHLALYGFVAIFVAVLASAIAYLAGRQPANPVAAVVLTKPVTVISSATVVRESPKAVAVAPAALVSKVVQEAPPARVAPQAPTPAILDDVLPNRMYLQVGSLEKNVAELLTQGLRIKGIPATIAPGVNTTVARIIVGPFQTSSEMAVVQKQVTELGFTPFPRQFQPSELRPASQNTSAVTPVKP